jgi:CxC4 like cysteine cluster associated with KDZ transposases
VGICRGISPETRDIGLFNFNGRILVAHDLLDEYTSAYTSSETPFVAWVTVVSRRYGIHSSGKPFLSEEMFRAVWFSYARLQQLEGDMKCPECGPSPETVIWDGVTLAFSRKQVLPSLRPPTTLDNDSPRREHCRYQPHQQLISDGALRKLIRKVIRGPSLPSGIMGDHLEEAAEEVTSKNGKDGKGPDDEELKNKTRAQAAAAAIDQIDGIESACKQLKMIDQGLGSLFEEHFGLRAYSTRHQVPSVFRELFIQVWTQVISQQI